MTLRKVSATNMARIGGVMETQPGMTRISPSTVWPPGKEALTAIVPDSLTITSGKVALPASSDNEVLFVSPTVNTISNSCETPVTIISVGTFVRAVPGSSMFGDSAKALLANKIAARHRSRFLMFLFLPGCW